MIWILLATGAFAIGTYYIVSRIRADQSNRRLQRATILAMQERLLLDGEMLYAMKRLMQEAALNQTAQKQEARKP